MGRHVVKKGFTIVEMLIAISLFAIVATISTQLFIDIVNLEKKSSIQNVFYEDARIIMQQISNYIQAGAIDYEEYYNRYVVHDNNGEAGYFGVNYGVYASRFYDPGKSLVNEPTHNPEDLGVECSYPAGADIDECDVVFTLATDLNTGQNPFEYAASDEGHANAFCDDPLIGGCDGAEIGRVTELYLIDSTGTEKTILARKKTGELTNDDWALGMMKLDGIDVDQNGVVDTWKCKEEFSCYGDGSAAEALEVATAIGHDYIQTASDVSAYDIRLPQYSDLGQVFDLSSSQFVPITPRRSSIKNLNFIIHPVEDPYRAFSEDNMQAHPSVTIVMTIGLTEAEAELYPGDFQDVTVQTTVTAGVLGKITSYPPTTDVGWIDGVLNVPDAP